MSATVRFTSLCVVFAILKYAYKGGVFARNVCNSETFIHAENTIDFGSL